MKPFDYWQECLSIAAEECGLTISAEQLKCLAGSVEAGHENYGMAFYSPPPSDRISDIEQHWQSKLNQKEAEFARYKKNAEEAVRIALNQRHGEHLSIEQDGEVLRHGGRTERIQ